MHVFRSILIVGLFVGIAGCHSSSYNSKVFHPWGYADAKEFEASIDDYDHVALVCVIDDRWEKLGSYSLHHFTGVVVKVYKGDWQISEKISFVQGLDYPVPASPPDTAGNLGFVFTSQSRDKEVSLDTGEFWGYKPDYVLALEHVASK